MRRESSYPRLLTDTCLLLVLCLLLFFLPWKSQDLSELSYILDIIQQSFYTSNNEIQPQQPLVKVTTATNTCLFSKISTCIKKLNPPSPSIPKTYLCNFDCCHGLERWPLEGCFFIKGSHVWLDGFNQKEQPSIPSLCEAMSTKEPCVMAAEICFCTKWEFILGMSNDGSCLGPGATRRGGRRRNLSWSG